MTIPARRTRNFEGTDVTNASGRTRVLSLRGESAFVCVHFPGYHDSRDRRRKNRVYLPELSTRDCPTIRQSTFCTGSKTRDTHKSPPIARLSGCATRDSCPRSSPNTDSYDRIIRRNCELGSLTLRFDCVGGAASRKRYGARRRDRAQ